MTDQIIFLCVLAATFLVTVLISRKLIPVLASHKMGQKILDIGPRWHKSKEGTPTMGGLAFIIASVICGGIASAIVWVTKGSESALPLILTLAMATLYGCIGIIDDMAKLRKKQNEGLTAAQKFLLQVVVAILYLVGMTFLCGLETDIYIPYFNIELPLGWGYYVVALLLIVGVDNSVNLTDGIDGLASSVTFFVAVFYSLAAFLAFEVFNVPLAIVGALMAGSAIGFLVYNFYPARVFMGDTGSLFFGGLVVGGAFIMNNPLIVVVCGIMFIVETASVMLQVGYFKLTHGKRLFKMSPIHHHFEKCGWKETKIVAVFSAVTVLFCVFAWFGLR
ncbi:MAG: phospho-N-acetylmuramoyl-pentapeptide-transferase [Clostridia bacterium]|nr:phospho-N-acetylmuramoyl-pentapeptide-transferase [Clostridia bacterium]